MRYSVRVCFTFIVRFGPDADNLVFDYVTSLEILASALL
jgi:hypothetical protein